MLSLYILSSVSRSTTVRSTKYLYIAFGIQIPKTHVSKQLILRNEAEDDIFLFYVHKMICYIPIIFHE